MTMPAANYNGVIQVVLDTVNSVQLKMKKIPRMMDEVREKQLENSENQHNTQQNQQPNVDPFTNEIYLTAWDKTVLFLGTIFIAPFRAVGVITALCKTFIYTFQC